MLDERSPHRKYAAICADLQRFGHFRREVPETRRLGSNSPVRGRHDLLHYLQTLSLQGRGQLRFTVPPRRRPATWAGGSGRTRAELSQESPCLAMQGRGKTAEAGSAAKDEQR